VGATPTPATICPAVVTLASGSYKAEDGVRFLGWAPSSCSSKAESAFDKRKTVGQYHPGGPFSLDGIDRCAAV
jgi:hypothetical protein